MRFKKPASSSNLSVVKEPAGARDSKEADQQIASTPPPPPRHQPISSSPQPHNVLQHFDGKIQTSLVWRTVPRRLQFPLMMIEPSNMSLVATLSPNTLLDKTLTFLPFCQMLGPAVADVVLPIPGDLRQEPLPESSCSEIPQGPMIVIRKFDVTLTLLLSVHTLFFVTPPPTLALHLSSIHPPPPPTQQSVIGVTTPRVRRKDLGHTKELVDPDSQKRGGGLGL
ncbi:unnamed protein product [Pleuronectes platessa]|uniref:Uncharacterized protein n=1 Tax=Pleuronectes platessa TaxID=8262 RepID=A0A9N7VQZ0_PLEPL|nr:unnamed protein product [Pleuronectes platessa]